VMLKDRRHPELRGSGIMYWRSGALLTPLFYRFQSAQHYYMERYKAMPMLGDQAYIQENVHPNLIATWPDGLTACINLDDETTCRAASLVYCSWIPKLPQLALEESWRGELVREHWR